MVVIRDLIWRRRELRGAPKFKKRPKRLVWRVPKPIKARSGDNTALSMTFPTVSRRKIRYLGRREVYPHSLHVHLALIRRNEEP